MNVSEQRRCEARISLASKAACCLGNGPDEFVFVVVIGVDVQIGTLLLERIGDGDCRELFT